VLSAGFYREHSGLKSVSFDLQDAKEASVGAVIDTTVHACLRSRSGVVHVHVVVAVV
jgi:hypothetical protein